MPRFSAAPDEPKNTLAPYSPTPPYTPTKAPKDSIQERKTPRSFTRKQPIVVHQQPRGCLSNCSFFGGIALVIMAAALAIIMLDLTNAIENFDPLSDIADVFNINWSEPAQEVDSQVLVLNIRSLAMLETTQGDILVEETIKKNRYGILKDAVLKMRYIGRVKAGIDLSTIKPDDITIENERVTIELPPVQITGCFLYEPSVNDWSCGTDVAGSGDCERVLQEMQRKAYRSGLEKLRLMVDELHIDESAYDDAEAALYDLLTSLGFSSIEFKQSDQPLTFDASCYPSD